jgi:hypothetical protein
MTIKLHRFKDLHKPGKDLIHTWFNRGWEQRNCPGGEAFEPFIYTYIAFNGWAACVTAQEKDIEMLKDLKRDQALRDCFLQWIAQDSEFHDLIISFSSLWPIFSARELRELRLDQIEFKTRSELIDHYLRGGATEFWPGLTDNRIILGNVLSAIYQVRCNLFHGGKGITSESDRKIVDAAFRVLVRWMEKCLHELDFRPAAIGRSRP